MVEMEDAAGEVVTVVMETLEERVKRVLQEEVSIATYNPAWPLMFEEEKRHLLECLPNDLIRRIEHFGSTAVPNLAAKPVVDILVEVTSLEETKNRIVPLLEAQGYDYFWRTDVSPAYAWFIKRDSVGKRTHHIHMVESDFEHWDRLLFRDYLIDHPQIAKDYEALKRNLASAHEHDRTAYTKGKAEFVLKVTRQAKEFYAGDRITG